MVTFTPKTGDSISFTDETSANERFFDERREGSDVLYLDKRPEDGTPDHFQDFERETMIPQESLASTFTKAPITDSVELEATLALSVGLSRTDGVNVTDARVLSMSLARNDTPVLAYSGLLVAGYGEVGYGELGYGGEYAIAG